MHRKSKSLDLLIIPLTYIILFVALLAGHAIDPTNLAGPGLDLIIFINIVIYALICITRSVIKQVFHKCMAHVAGLLISILLATFIL